MTNPSSPTPSGHLAFLHRRPFWIAFLGLQVVVSLLLCIQLLGVDFTSLWFYEAITGFMGASLLALLVGTLIENQLITQMLALGLFLILYTCFLYRTFRNSFVSILYPILLTSLWFLSTSYLVSLL